MLVEWGVAGTQLGEDGGLFAVEVFDQFEVSVGGKGFVNGRYVVVTGGSFPMGGPLLSDPREVVLAEGRDAQGEGERSFELFWEVDGRARDTCGCFLG